jgi:hypothetical protein
MWAEFYTLAVFVRLWSLDFKLVIYVKNNFEDATILIVPSQLLHNKFYKLQLYLSSRLAVFHTRLRIAARIWRKYVVRLCVEWSYNVVFH